MKKIMHFGRWKSDFNRRSKNQPDDVFQKLNSNHPNMKYAVEVKPEIFLDIKIVYCNDVITIQVRFNERKSPVHKVLKQYERNAIISALNKAACIANFPVDEIPNIKLKFLNADYSHRFINSVIKKFQEKSEETNDYIIPPGLFDVPKKAVLRDIPSSPKNEEFSKPFMKNDNKYDYLH